MLLFAPTGGLGAGPALPTGGLGAGVPVDAGGGGGGFRNGRRSSSGFHLGPVLHFDPIDVLERGSGALRWGGEGEVLFEPSRDELEALFLLELDRDRLDPSTGGSACGT